MIAASFVDTNVLIYAASNAILDQPKRQIARAVLAMPDIGFSAQVMQEFYSVATAQKHLKMTHDEAVAVLQSLATFPVLPITRDLVLEAVGLKTRFGISYWDAAILAAAKQMGCQKVLSEDLNDGQNYDGVTVVDPFAVAGP